MNLLVFFLLNFGALALGGALIGNPGENDWYLDLNKAPFTPPGWVFGFAWTTIMICFSFFMYHLTAGKKLPEIKNIVFIYILQWILNVSWNPLFFRFHEVAISQIVLVLLTITVFYFLLLSIREKSKLQTILILPYFAWLLVANGLNGYILLYN